MKRNIALLLLGVLMVGVLSACSGIASGASINAAGDPSSSSAAHTLTVTGIGKVTVIPDVAYLTIGVHTEGKVVAEALQSNTTQAQKVADSLKALGVDSKDIQTTSFNIYPQQNFGPQGEVTDTKYVVNNSVYVIVHNLSKMGDILNAVVSSGANNINGIQYDISDKDKALSESRSLAVHNALLQATDLSKSAGVTLGQVQSINAINDVLVPNFGAKGGAAMATSNGALPISAGQLIVTVQVTATYEIK